MKSRVNRFGSGLTVLYASGGSDRTLALCEALRNRGHSVTPVSSVREILDFEDASDAIVIDTLGGRSDDYAFEFRQLEELHSVGVELPIVAIVRRAGFDICREAAALGIAHVVQGAFEPTELVLAVERSADPNDPDSLAVDESRSEYEFEDGSLECAIDDLHETLLTAGVAPEDTVRALAACAEIIDNVCRHAFPSGAGRFKVDARIRRTRLRIKVSDDGTGFDAAQARLDTVPAALPVRRSRRQSEPVLDTGLARVGLLCDRVGIESNDSGSRITLDFEFSPIRLALASRVDTETCMPNAIAGLVAEVRAGTTALDSIPRVLAATVRRLVRGSRVTSRDYPAG